MKLFIILILFCYAGLSKVSAINVQQFNLSDPIIQIGNQYFYALDSPCVIDGNLSYINGEENQGTYLENTTITSIEGFQNGEYVKEEMNIEIIYDTSSPKVYGQVVEYEEGMKLELTAKDDYYTDRIVYSQEPLEMESILTSTSFFDGEKGELEVSLGDCYYCYGIDESNNVSEELEISVIDDETFPLIDSISYLSGENVDGIQIGETLDFIVEAHDEHSLVYSVMLMKDEEVIEEIMDAPYEFHILTKGNDNYHIVVKDQYGNETKENLMWVMEEDHYSPVLDIEVQQFKSYSNVPVSFKVYAQDEYLKTIEYSDNGQMIEIENNSTVTISEEGNHLIYFQAVDESGNCTTSNLYEFELDMTPPEIICNYDGNLISNHSETMNFVIEEKNLDQIQANVEYIQSIQEDKVILTMNLDHDQYYEPEVTVTDLAGNFSTYSLSRILIDRIVPVISIEGVANQQSYQNVGDIHVSVSDDYLTSSCSTLKNLTNDTAIEGTETRNGRSHCYDYQPELLTDGNYELNVYGIDLAGNVQTLSYSFVQNSQGSRYQIDSDHQEIEIIETNLSEISNTAILVNRNGNAVIADVNEDYSINMEKNTNGEYVYTYHLNPDLFSDDGTYLLTIYSKDIAGNMNQKTLDQFEISVEENEMEIVLLDQQLENYEDSEETDQSVDVYIDGQKAETVMSDENVSQEEELEIIEVNQENSVLKKNSKQNVSELPYLSGALLGVALIGAKWRKKYATKGRNK